MAPESEKLTFIVEWLEPLATIPRRFILTFYLADNSVSLFDVERKRYFLSRTVCSTVTKPNFFIGNVVNVMSRQLKIIDYGDSRTKHILENIVVRSLLVLKPRVFQHLGVFLDKLANLKMEVKNIRMEKHTEDSVNYFKKWSSKSVELSEVLLETPVIMMELSGSNISRWREIDLDIPDFSNDVFCSEDENTLKTELGLLFNGNRRLGKSTVTFKACSCCIIKPHAVVAGNSGKIIGAINNAGFIVTALEMFHLTVKQAYEFLEVYKGLVTNFEDSVDELASGPCLCMEVHGSNPTTVVQELRQLAGPSDPVIAKTLKPGSLRARFGQDKAKNAVHCTDLPEDGELEVEFFFKFMCCNNE